MKFFPVYSDNYPVFTFISRRNLMGANFEVNMKLNIFQSLGKYNAVTKPMNGLWYVSDKMAGKYALFSKAGKDFTLGTGYKPDQIFFKDDIIPQEAVIQICLALMKTNKFVGDECRISFMQKNAGEVRDALRELVRCGNAGKLLFINDLNSSEVLKDLQIRQLLGSLNSENGAIVLSAVIKLANLCKDQTPKPFISLIHDSKWPSVRQAVQKALLNIKDENLPQALIDSLAQYKPATNDEYYLSTVNILISKCYRNLEVIHNNLINHPDAYIRRALVSVIYETYHLGNPAEATALLWVVANRDNDQSVRELATHYLQLLSV
jgi:hypothetical protein